MGNIYYPLIMKKINIIGFKLRDYRFEIYKNVSKKDFKIDEVRILGFHGKYSLELERFALI